MRINVPKWVKTVHKYLSLLVFIQLLIWLVSGFWLGRLANIEAVQTQVSLPITKIPSSHLLKDPSEILLIHENLSQQNQVLAKETIKLSLVPFTDNWVYKLTHQESRHHYWESRYSIYDAITGKRIEIDEANATELAKASYALTPLLKSVNLMEPPIADLPRQQNSVWQISMVDNWQTRIYVHAQSGEILAHKTSHSDLKALLLKLHFMDYANKGSFNNIFIQCFAVLTFLMSASGLYWLSILGIKKIRKQQNLAV